VAVSAFSRPAADTSRSAIAELVTELVQSALANSRAASTLAAYESGWNSYTRVCRLFKMKALPITEAKLISYVVLAHDKLDLLSKTIRNYCIAIAFRHRLQRLDDPRKSGNLLKLGLDGCRRQDVNGGYEKRLRLGNDGEDFGYLVQVFGFDRLSRSSFCRVRCN